MEVGGWQECTKEPGFRGGGGVQCTRQSGTKYNSRQYEAHKQDPKVLTTG